LTGHVKRRPGDRALFHWRRPWPARKRPGRIAKRGIQVILHEMRGVRGTDAHQTDGLAELVCSNSFRSDDDEHNAVGLLHGRCAWRFADHGRAMPTQVPAGGALAVDRDGFSAGRDRGTGGHPLITIARGSHRPAAGRLGPARSSPPAR
jgi:folate-dependent tRNA-U54 methylase TrmFO/GidA